MRPRQASPLIRPFCAATRRRSWQCTERSTGGASYRVGARPLPGLRRTADLVFTRWKIAVFLDGCFWHGWPDHFVAPKTNGGDWGPKVAGT
jgi:DNA mismatch endonuclease Vsr